MEIEEGKKLSFAADIYQSAFTELILSIDYSYFRDDLNVRFKRLTEK
jgi:hypothetical protein